MLKGKVAIITGSTRGIGKQIALKYASLGCDIVINYKSENDIDRAKVVEEEIKEFGVKTLIVKADVSSLEDCVNLCNETKKTFGKIDILVNNAGITKDNLIIRMSEEDFDRVIDINLKGSFNCLKAVTQIMMKQKYGKIINMSSVVGITGNAGQVNYCASKAGVIGMTKSLAREVGSRGINVNAIAPGFIETDMTDVLTDEQKKNILNQIPLKKMGSTEDIANIAVFLGSDYSNYITGQVISVDGGMSM